LICIFSPLEYRVYTVFASNHACISGAQSMVLGVFFPAERTRLNPMAEEAALSRLQGGLHYRFDNETGLRLGRKVADLALSLDIRDQAFRLPRATTSPN
jgi:PAP2 superfamily.